MGRRRSYVKTYKVCLRLPTIEEIEESELQEHSTCMMNSAESATTTVQDSADHRSGGPAAGQDHEALDDDDDQESCRGTTTIWPGYATLLRTKLAKLQEMKETLQPPARQLVEKMKDTCEDMMVFVTTKTVQQCRAVQLVWGGSHQFFKNLDFD